MPRRALAVVATQGISPVMAMPVALVIALILLLAAPVKAQETTAEETTMVSADAANGKVVAKTDHVSAEVNNGKVSVSTGNGSSSNKGTSQQSSLTVQQNQTTEGIGSQAASNNLNITQNSSSSCKNPKQVGSLDQEDADSSISFTTKGQKFRVSYDVTFKSGTQNKDFRLEVKRNGTVVESDETKENVTDKSFIVSAGPDNYELVATEVQPKRGTTFSATVDDCVGTNNNNGNNNNRNNNNRHHHNRRHHNHHHNNNNNNAANKQYTSQRTTVEETVIKRTIPNKGTLANTGGVPLVGLAFFALAMVGLGISVVRFAIRRER